ncbi:helicase [Paenibacillus silvae]|uniref:Helicase n=1 Tax=Paenibacillus silvae TaxID=1325358 RepID=A0ABQ1Z7U4_9BACL|nr:ABC transporter ATP-binding protein [Paenibacillus silvae]GGH50390.1 helicase [Paenibacillus silvae]
MKVSFDQYKELYTQYISPQRAKVIFLLILLLSGISLQLISPQILRHYIDAAGTSGGLEILKVAALLYIGLTIVNQIIQIFETYIGESVAWTATNALRQVLTLHCLKLDTSFHQQHSSGEMIERIDGDVTNLANFFSRFVIQVLGNILLIFGVVFILIIENIWVGLCFAVFTVLALFTLNRIREYATPFWVIARQASAKFFGFLGERLTAVEEIRTNQATSYVMRKLHENMSNLLIKERKAYVRARALWPATILVFAVGYALVFILGSYLMTNELISMGTLFLMFYYMDILRAPLENITLQMEDFQKASASIQRIQELMSMKTNIEEENKATLSEEALAVEFNNVTFSYDKNSSILNNLSFTLEAGKTLGLLGRTGSGKTTITRLLLRLQEAGSGNLYIGGHDIRHIPLADLREHVSIVTQDVRLFSATVRDNITMFDSSASDENIVKTLEEIGLGDWFKGLPEGLYTEISPTQNGLSAGQVQLLAFARVFLKNPGLVILDEASSRLDPGTEKLVDKAMKKLFKGRTAIIIAHRLQTVQKVDEIMILEDGNIVEYGKPENLEQDQHSRFAQLKRAGLKEVIA